MAVFLMSVSLYVSDLQSSLWVGTAGGTLVVFTVTRNDKHQLLLKRTGELYLGMELNVLVTDPMQAKERKSLQLLWGFIFMCQRPRPAYKGENKAWSRLNRLMEVSTCVCNI